MKNKNSKSVKPDIEKQRVLLLSLRSKLVGSKHTLPYTIYKDEDIESLLKEQPHTINDLGSIKGFPKDGKRIKGFGEAIIAIFNKVNDVEEINLTFNSGKPEISVKLREMHLFDQI